MAVLLYERWKWTHADVVRLRVSDFLFYYEQVSAIIEAEIQAAERG